MRSCAVLARCLAAVQRLRLICRCSTAWPRTHAPARLSISHVRRCPGGQQAIQDGQVVAPNLSDSHAPRHAGLAQRLTPGRRAGARSHLAHRLCAMEGKSCGPHSPQHVWGKLHCCYTCSCLAPSLAKTTERIWTGRIIGMPLKDHLHLPPGVTTLETATRNRKPSPVDLLLARHLGNRLLHMQGPAMANDVNQPIHWHCL